MSRHLTVIKSRCYWCEAEAVTILGAEGEIVKTYKNSLGQFLPVCKKHDEILSKVWETKQIEDGLWVVVKDEVV